MKINKSTKKAIHSIGQSVANLLCPPRCLQCNQIISSLGFICSHCWNLITFISSNCCEICGLKSKLLKCSDCQISDKQKIIKRHAIIYDTFSYKIFRKFKFYNAPYLSQKLGQLIIYASKDIIKDIDLIIPVPMTNLDIIIRGYNQSLLLAKEISKYYKIKLDHNIIVKNKRTKKQSLTKTLAERISNVSNSFQMTNEAKIKGKNILIVDDIYTTGSTIKECIKTLKSAKEVRVVTLGYAKSNTVNNY